jgi:DNA-binding CsgD family transcriptional regulator
MADVDGALVTPALSAALELLEEPAFVVDAAGAVALANAAGRARMSADPAAAQRIGELIATPTTGSARVVPLAGEGGPVGALVIEGRGPEARAQARLDAMATDLSLTRRQREILTLVSRGLSNRGIATALSISEATVEQHVGTLMQRAGVESRAALIARLLWG